MANSNNHFNNDNPNVDNMSPSELKAYYRGLKRGIGITVATASIREAIMINYSRYPQLRYTRGEPMIVAQELINQAFIGMKQPIPTPQEISIYDITSSEVGMNILSSLMRMNNTTNPGVQKDSNTRPPIRNENTNREKPKKQKIPYDREKAKKSGAFELSKQEREELK